jgi:hypothetical protein
MNVLEKGTRDAVAAASSKQAFQSMYVLEKGTGDVLLPAQRKLFSSGKGGREECPREGNKRCCSFIKVSSAAGMYVCMCVLEQGN